MKVSCPSTSESARARAARIARSIASGSSKRSSAGPLLQGKLLALESARVSSNEYPFSYKEHHWDDMYLGGRWALPVNSNPFYLLRSLPAAPLADSPDSTENLGGLLSALVRFHLLV